MRARVAALLALAVAAAPCVRADEPSVEHQPSPCTIPGKLITLCASVTDDGQVAKARIYFRPSKDKYYSFVEMAFTGITFCGTLPAPREGKLQSLDYYVQGVDDEYETKRTSTFQMNVQPEGVCEFPPVDAAAAGKPITVHATSQKQGKKLPDQFDRSGVTFVPVGKK